MAVPATTCPFPLGVLPVARSDSRYAARLARRLGIALLPPGRQAIECDAVSAVLLVSGDELALQRTGPGAPGPVAAAFDSGAMRRRRRAGGSEALGRAVGAGKKQPLRVVDSTAGLGRDACVLAHLGCEVILCERVPVVAELLRAGMHSARQDPVLAPIVGRMSLHGADARLLPAETLSDVDVIFLDPMFPALVRRAASKKEMALLQSLLGPADPGDADALLRWALRQEIARVVVKRPLRSKPLADLQPVHCLSGKTVRYDVYVRRALTA